MKIFTTINRGQTRRGLVLCSSLILCWSCATTELADSWKSENFDTLSNAKILVVSENPEMDVRKSYETAIANKLRGINLDAVESHIQFPSLKGTKTPDEKANSAKMFKEAGILGIILTSLKQTIETQKGTISKPIGSLEGYADKKSSVSNPNGLKKLFATTSKTYVLETLIYNLALQEGEQLVGVFLVDITNPASSDVLRKAFIKVIANQFK